MDVDLSAVHAAAASAFRRVAAGVGPGQWDADTPCDGWSVRELVNHVASGNLWVGELVAGKSIAEVGDRLEGDLLGDAPVEITAASCVVAVDAFNGDGAMDAPCAVSYGPVPGSVYCGHRIVDLVGHGWDLATATGQPTDIDPALVSACIEILEPQLEMLAGSGMFGEPSDPGASVPPQARLLAMLGR